MFLFYKNKKKEYLDTISCSKCGKKLIEVSKDKTKAYFCFGVRPGNKKPHAVQMRITGETTIEMRCLRRRCNYVTQITLKKE